MVVSVAECSYVSVTEAASTSSTTSLEERRTLQMRREQEMLARRREETRYCQNYNFISNWFELVCEVFFILSFIFLCNLIQCCFRRAEAAKDSATKDGGRRRPADSSTEASRDSARRRTEAVITEPSTEGRRRTEPQSDESSRDGGRKIDVRPAAGDNAVRKEGGRGRDGEGDGQRTVIRQRVRRPESGNCSFQYQIHEMNEPINFGLQMLTEILFIKNDAEERAPRRRPPRGEPAE